MRDASRTRLVAYGVAVLATAVSLVIRWPLMPLLGYHAPLMTFFPAIILSAYLGGLGPGLAAAVGRPLTEVFRIINEQTRRPVEDPAAKVLRSGTVVGLANHTALLARDGRGVPIDDCGAPIVDGRGAIAGVVLVFRDVTQR